MLDLPSKIINVPKTQVSKYKYIDLQFVSENMKTFSNVTIIGHINENKAYLEFCLQR